jgi:DNA-binding NtrC family response regulator
VALLDQKLPDGFGVDLCEPILAQHDQAKIIFITAFPSFDNAVKAVRSGACDYLSKPVDTEELRLTVEHAFRTLELERVEQIHEYTKRKDNAETVLVGGDKGLKEVRQLMHLASGSDVPTLITGETGTGKNVVAKCIHYMQADKRKSFVGINCASLPDNLIEAELFGYEKGAFTGAVSTRKGIFEMAEGGTLFLDEIGELPIHLQAKLLGILDEKQLKRLGGQSFKKIDVRIIAATNIDLEDAVRNKRFREDLYFRLSVLRIHIPPLRQRLEDIADLCRHFLEKAVHHSLLTLPDEEIGQLQCYHWPGNVRELKNIIERAILLRENGQIRPSSLLSNGSLQRPDSPQAQGERTPPVTLSEMERLHIRSVLRQMDNNHSRTAKALDISRSTLLRKLKQYQIKTGEA